MTTELGATLDEPAPAVSLAEARELAAEFFGVVGTAEPLGGERDRNFRVREQDGRAWVLKVVHPAEDPVLTDLQSTALLRIAERDPNLPVPRVRLPIGGPRPDAVWHRLGSEGEQACRVRMYSYLAGTPTHLVPPSTALRADLGRHLARLDAALAGLRHPAEHHDLAWDAQKATRVHHLLAADDHLSRRLLAHFREHAAPVLPGLRSQLIHNDVNPQNVLVEPTGTRVAGIIDFGDTIRAPLVQELATACAYRISEGTRPLDAPIDIVRAYHAIHTLTERELDVMYDLIVARLIVIIAITRWRAGQHPENGAYILRNHRRARIGLERVAAVGCRTAHAELRRILED